MSDRAEKVRLKRLADGILAAQGNVFIKEFLRDHGLRIGATKSDFTRNLHAAIDEGKLTSSDIEEWLHRVEGWGSEHVYLYTVPARASKPEWGDPSAVEKAVRRAGLGHLWEAQSSLEFPDEPTLTGIYHRGEVVRFVWHEGSERLIRAPAQDPDDQVIDGDLYEFHAYRKISERKVMRFDLRPKDRVAAAFVQVPLRSEEHKAAVAHLWESVAFLVSLDELVPLEVSSSIKTLDQEQLGDARPLLQSSQTRLSGAGAYVEFGATSPGHGYGEVGPIREARLALQLDEITGKRATMFYASPEGTGPPREVRVLLYADDRRVYVPARLTEEQMWQLLHVIRRAA
jgi:hypothetical protein